MTNKYPNPLDDQQSEEERRQLLDGLGLTEPSYRPDGEAPAVDREAIRALVRSQVSEDERDRLSILLARYKCWAKTYADVVREEQSI